MRLCPRVLWHFLSSACVGSCVNSEGFWTVGMTGGGWGASAMSDKHWERSGGAGWETDWKAPGGTGKKGKINRQPWERVGRELWLGFFYSRSFTPCLLVVQQPCRRSEPLHQPIRQPGVWSGKRQWEAVRYFASARSAVPFQASASLFQTRLYTKPRPLFRLQGPLPLWWAWQQDKTNPSRCQGRIHSRRPKAALPDTCLHV